ncbi:hypothetical protein J3Q64DRAFT_1422939 [Phycomyces blakesleeanus]|uniref:Uncharacterized protein n=1 Tax=Phycomyces blakesleeanus TaxID=4837 RepID=A0ABR3AHC0_PHYBL
MHNFIPKLEYLDSNPAFRPIPNDDIEKIRHITPAHTITSIGYNYDFLDASWIFYLALKYPNLCSIVFFDSDKKNAKDSIVYSRNRHQEDIQLLATLDQFFPCLTSVNTLTGSHNGWPFSIFYDTLRNFGVNPESVTVNILKGGEQSIYSHNRCLLPISESLKISKQSLDFPRFKMPISNYISSYPNLFELYLESSSVVEIDIIIDKCPALQVLKIHRPKICLSNHPLYPTVHTL